MSKLSNFIRNSSLVTEDSTPREIRRLITRHKQFAKDIDFGPKINVFSKLFVSRDQPTNLTRGAVLSNER